MKNKKLNKKAISNIVVSVLLIMLALVAVTALFVTIKKLKEPLLAPQACLDIKLNNLVSYNACYEEENKEARINIVNLGLKINELEFLLNFNGQIETYSCDCLSCEIDGKVYYIETEKPDKLALKVNDCLLEEVGVVEC